MSVYSSSVCAHNTTVDLPPPPSPSHRFTFTQYCNEILNCIVSKVMCICPVCTTPRLFRLTGARRAPRSSFTAPEGRLKTCIYILQMNYSSKAMYVCMYVCPFFRHYVSPTSNVSKSALDVDSVQLSCDAKRF